MRYKYKYLIEKYFLIDEPKTGQLVPFKFNLVQEKYYNELIRDYDIETKGVESCIRDVILKARREGFSSMILALFAADDILQENPTETCVISYKDDATKVFSKRYKLYIESYFQNKFNTTKGIFEVDNGNELILKHNKARFYCGTASARTAARGGVVQKLLFSEMAFYPDGDKLTAREIVEGTMRQMDIQSGLCFIETTANGYGNHYEKTWSLAQKGESRFKPRFYGALEFYTEEELEIIKSEFTDKQMFKQEYPRTPDEAFIASGSSYFDNETIIDYLKTTIEPRIIGSIQKYQGDIKIYEEKNGPLKIWEYPDEYSSYVIGGDVAEGIEGGDYSVLEVINNKTLKTAAKFKARIPPDEFAKQAFILGMYYNQAYMGIEVNKDGLWVNTELFKNGYPNLYYREALDDITNRTAMKLGFKTDQRTKPYILSELRKTLSHHKDCWNNKDFLEECLTFTRGRNGSPNAMLGKHDDEIISVAIALEIRRNAPEAFNRPEYKSPQESIVLKRLERLYGKKDYNNICQDSFI